MAVDLQKVVAVQNEQQEGIIGHLIIGHLMWYSVGNQLIERDELERKLASAGLDEGWMPNPIQAHGAFRRATSEIQTKRSTAQAGVHENYLVREVYYDKDMVQRNVVVETVDQKGKRLNYDSQAAVITLDKKTQNISVVSTNPTAEELAREAEQRFYLYRDHHSAQHIRAMLANILKSLAPTPVRPSGGVYFVPSSHEDGLRKLCRFASSLENSEGFMVPLVNTMDNRQMVNQKLKEHFERIIKECGSASDDLKKWQVKQIVEDARQAITNYKDYRSLVSDDFEAMETYIGNIRVQVARLMESL